jgi:DNA processing protein
MLDYKYWMALDQSPGMGPAHMKMVADALAARGIGIADVFGLGRGELKEEFAFADAIIGALSEAAGMLNRVEADYLKLIDAGVEAMLFFEKSYPARLIQRLKNSYPPVLYTLGSRELLKARGCAVLGDKDVSDKGAQIAHHAAIELSRHRIPVVSGLARGADQIAHRAAVEAGGATIALVPYGMFNLGIPDILKDVYHPDRFLVISPFYPTTTFSTYNAYNRNRIICALSYAVYIVECPAAGGIFEAGKSAQKTETPLFVTEYADYPKSAGGNKILIDEMGAVPVRGRVKDNAIIPNLDRLIGAARFSD